MSVWDQLAAKRLLIPKNGATYVSPTFPRRQLCCRPSREPKTNSNSRAPERKSTAKARAEHQQHQATLHHRNPTGQTQYKETLTQRSEAKNSADWKFQRFKPVSTLGQALAYMYENSCVKLTFSAHQKLKARTIYLLISPHYQRRRPHRNPYRRAHA